MVSAEVSAQSWALTVASDRRYIVSSYRINIFIDQRLICLLFCFRQSVNIDTHIVCVSVNIDTHTHTRSRGIGFDGFGRDGGHQKASPAQPQGFTPLMAGAAL